MHILAQLGQGVERILNFKHTASVLDKVVIHLLKILLVKHCPVLSPNVKHVAIKWPVVCLIIGMGWWPLIKIELEIEHLALKQASHLNTLLYKSREVSFEKEWGNEGILVFYDVLNDDLDSTYLIIFQSVINCWSVEESFLVIWLGNLVFVEHWEVRLEKIAKSIIQNVFHGPTIERQDWGHVSAI